MTTAASSTYRKILKISDFQKICRRAARRSTNCREYICGVLTGVCSWLGIPDSTESIRNECQFEGGNVQLVLLTLYRLLEERCSYNFDALEVLNSYSAGDH
jgi:hypothetical protein